MFLSTLSVKEVLLTQIVWGCIIKEGKVLIRERCIQSEYD